MKERVDYIEFSLSLFPNDLQRNKDTEFFFRVKSMFKGQFKAHIKKLSSLKIHLTWLWFELWPHKLLC